MPTHITFDADYPGYAPGTVAAFRHDEAVRLVNSRVTVDGQETRLAHLSTEDEIKASMEPAPAPKAEISLRVRFIKPNVGPYQAGDVALFPKSVAQKLVNDEVALWEGDEGKPEEPGFVMPSSTFNARAAVLRSLDQMNGDELRAAHVRLIGKDPGKKSEAAMRNALRADLEPRTGGPVASPKTGETKPAVTK